ncbi:MAG: DUF4013 domain-containing protein [Methanobrevibacter sp.]
MDKKYYFNLLKDAFRYAISDWKAILILGIFLYVISYIEDNVIFKNGFNTLTYIFLLIVLIIFSFIESGYSFKILEETVSGSRTPPIFGDYLELLKHGIKDSIVVMFYMVIVIFILVLSFELPFHGYKLFVFSMGLVFAAIVYILMLGAFLNLAYNNGDLRSGFAIGDIIDLLKGIGVSKLILVYLLVIMSEGLIVLFVFVNIPLDNPFILFVMNLFITPFFVIFSKRAFALSSL